MINKNKEGFNQKEGITEHVHMAQNMFSYNKHLGCAFRSFHENEN